MQITGSSKGNQLAGPTETKLVDGEHSSQLKLAEPQGSEVIGQNREAIEKLEAMPSQQPGLDSETLEALK